MSNRTMLVTFGIMDILLEICGIWLICLSDPHNTMGLIIGYGSIGIDIVKTVCVLIGFCVCCCVSSEGATEGFKVGFGSVITVLEAIIIIVSTFLFIFIVIEINPNSDVWVYMFFPFCYSVGKAATILGYLESLRNCVNEARIIEPLNSL